jgi:uncharacterized protein YecE (DUF72 family)/chaperonin cofactor prefoldin
VIRLATPSNRLFLGTSGWSYKEWIGPFYSKEDKSMLHVYTRVFSSVEIDSTFYRYPSKGTVMGWARYSPEGFVYTAKLPKLITHEKRLDLGEGIKQDLQQFLELMEPLSLSGKLGCILIQLPPRFNFKPKELEDFFKLLPGHVRFAIEFRNLSWMRKETWTLLEKYRVAYTIVDEPLLPPEIHVTTDFAYFRWHGRGSRPWFDYEYSAEELEPWVPRVKEVTERVERVYGYFNNHYHGYAVENCLQVLEMLGALTSKQTEAKRHVENHFRRSAESTESTLETFVQPTGTDLERLLHYFIDVQRLKRAEEIKDNELTITAQTDNRVQGTIREYHIIIDIETRTIEHDCADWERVSPNKKLCKHVGKLLLSIDKERAEEILKELYEHLEAWQFKPYVAE